MTIQLRLWRAVRDANTMLTGGRCKYKTNVGDVDRLTAASHWAATSPERVLPLLGCSSSSSSTSSSSKLRGCCTSKLLLSPTLCLPYLPKPLQLWPNSKWPRGDFAAVLWLVPLCPGRLLPLLALPDPPLARCLTQAQVNLGGSRVLNWILKQVKKEP